MVSTNATCTSQHEAFQMPVAKIKSRFLNKLYSKSDHEFNQMQKWLKGHTIYS